MNKPTLVRLLFCLLTPLNVLFGTENNLPTIKELTEFALNIESSIENGNPYYFNQCFDKELLIKNTIPDSNDDYTKGFIDGFIKYFDLGTVLTEEISFNGKYSYQTSYFSDNKASIVFRMVNSFGINYHEFNVIKTEDKLKISDAYIFLSSEKISDMVKKTYITNKPSDDIKYSEREFKDMYQKLDVISSYDAAGKYARSYRKWKKLPDSYKQIPHFQVKGIQLAMHLNSDRYLDHYKYYRKTMPESKGKYLVPVEGLIVHGYYKEALACIDSSALRLKYDPVLNVLRSNVYLKAGNLSAAADCLLKVIEACPDYEFIYYNLLGIYIHEKEYEEATRLLEKMTFVFRFFKEDFQVILTEYTDFLASNEYMKWLDE